MAKSAKQGGPGKRVGPPKKPMESKPFGGGKNTGRRPKK